MISYGPLAAFYDSLTQDVNYPAYADVYEREFRNDGGEFRLLLDLCCGTGSLTSEMCDRGYEMIAVDASTDMLMQAQCKEYSGVRPLFLCQSAEELDLYGTVDACFSSLDSFNYIPGECMEEIFRRLHLFIRPGGLFIFDIRTPEWLENLDGQIFVDENDDLLCLWRAEKDLELNAIVYGMDIFTKRGRLWDRSREEHVEYIHQPDTLQSLLQLHGFTELRLLKETPDENNGRIFLCCRRSMD